VVYVRNDGEALAQSCAPNELLAEGGSVAARADTLISLSSEGPFAPLAVALERNDALRDVVAASIPAPSLTAWSRARLVVLALAAVPLLMLVELDRELLGKELLGTGRLLVDVLLAAYVVFELTRRTPRMPAVAGVALLSVAMRWFLVTARLCGKGVHPAVWAAAALSFAAALAILARAPSRARVSLELMGKLGISRSEANAVRAASISSEASEASKGGRELPGTLVLAAIGAAAGLPLVLWLLRRSGAGIWLQATSFVAYAAVLPAIVLRRHGKDERARISRADVERAIFAIALGLVLTAALLHGTHQFFDAGGELARCTGRLDEATRRLLAAEASELARRVASVRASTALVLMTTAVMPLAEERIYRGLLMNVLVRKYGFTYGLFASAAAFGLAHVGVYELALYQTVLLGIGFGLAYAEGGLVAAFVVHAVWNLLNVA
jgi:membrane protease YdiL (CAAX protease family)